MAITVASEDGKPIKDINPFPVKMVDANGNAIATDSEGNMLVKQTGSNVKKAFEIIPDDDNDLDVNALSLTCTADGIAYVDFVEGGTNIPIRLVAGYWNPVNVKRVRATDTTAAGIVGQEA